MLQDVEMNKISEEKNYMKKLILLISKRRKGLQEGMGKQPTGFQILREYFRGSFGTELWNEL